MISIRERKVNTTVKRGALIAELLVVVIFEHVSFPVQLGLAAIGGFAGLLAGWAFLYGPSAPADDGIDVRASEEPSISALSGSLAEINLGGVRPLTPVICSAYVPTVYEISDLYAIPAGHLYGHPLFRNYGAIVDLGCPIHWRASELEEVLKAVSAVDRQFTVELRTDSILIHCDPVDSALEQNSFASEREPMDLESEELHAEGAAGWAN